MKKIKKTAIWIILIAVAVAIGFVIYENKGEKTEYSLVSVNRGTLTQTISADGKYLSKDEASVSFRLSGPLTGIKVDVGDKVKKGQLLASVDTGTLTENWSKRKRLSLFKKRPWIIKRTRMIFIQKTREPRKKRQSSKRKRRFPKFFSSSDMPVSMLR